MLKSPLSLSEFSRFLSPLSPSSRIAIAVSGGPDSLALCSLLSRLYPPSSVLAIHIDHRLRPTSTAEATRLGSILTNLNLPHVILPAWPDRSPPTTQIEKRARDERYRILIHTIHSRLGTGADLLVGHHLNDAIETILFRFGRCSGIDGLSGIIKSSEMSVVEYPLIKQRVLRPLLDVQKERLVATCQEMGLEWVEDEMNQSELYQRNVLRKELKGLSEKENVDLKTEGMKRFMLSMKSHKNYIENQVEKVMNKNLKLDKQTGIGFLRLGQRNNNWLNNDSIALRVLAKLPLMFFKSSDNSVLTKNLNALSLIRQGKSANYCDLMISKSVDIKFRRDLIVHRQPPMKNQQSSAKRKFELDEQAEFLFDERFIVCIKPSNDNDMALKIPLESLKFIPDQSFIDQVKKCPTDFNLCVRFTTKQDFNELRNDFNTLYEAADLSLRNREKLLHSLLRRIPITARSTFPIVVMTNKKTKEERIVSLPFAGIDFECGWNGTTKAFLSDSTDIALTFNPLSIH